jgi:hypothetical protein
MQLLILALYIVADDLTLLLLVLKGKHCCLHIELTSSEVILKDIERVF